MRTLVALENNIWPRCYNAMLGALRKREGVQRVWSDFSAGCLVIDHVDDADALVSFIMTAGRAVAVAANGEKVMVHLDAHEAAECWVSKHTVIRTPPKEEWLTMTSATSPDGTGAAGSIARSPGSPQEMVPTAGSSVTGTAVLDVVDEWGYESFPASDPPQSWCYERSRSNR